MKAAIKFVFAGVTAVLFALAAFTVLWGAYRTPMFEPNDAHTFLLNTVGGAIIAFIAVQLGIALASPPERPRDNFGVRANRAMGSASDAGMWLLLIDAGVFLLAGVLFVLLWVKPGLIAVQADAPRLTAAPEYIATQAKAFVGVTLAALAGLAPSATS